MRFGWMTLSHSPDPESDQTAINTLLDQACYAETLGFDGVWLTEHNFTGEAVYCDPIPFASALAARTTRIRIGFAVIQLALRHPVRLAVQLALLDNLSNGRIDVGVGRGSLYNEYEYIGYGLRSTNARELADEALDVMVRAWTEAPFSYRGRHFTLDLPALRPRVVQRPYPPIWRSVVSPDSFKECGRMGVHVLTAPIPRTLIVDRLRLYAEGLEAGGHDSAKRRSLIDSAAIWRRVYVGESQAEAEDVLANAMLETRKHLFHVREAHNPPDFAIDPAAMFPFNNPAVSHEDAIRSTLEHSSLVGTPARVAEQVAALREVGVRHLLCQLSVGYTADLLIRSSMRRFGEEVMPKFRETI
jgi:alkanesulfonate monooxygenase SsuD/methylene tetrahydromethanopterin reductase-like flavin-dependent oxidoreductase (luciferase family)